MGKKLMPVLLLAVVCYCQAAYAQLPPSSVSVSVNYLPASRYNRPLGKEKFEKTQSSTVQQRISFTGNFLLSNKTDTVTGRNRSWGMAVRANYNHFNNSGYEQKVIPGELLETDVTLQHYRSLKNNWGLYSSLSAGVYTDMEKIDGNDLFITAALLFIKRKPRYSYGFGAVVNNATGVPLPFPAVYFQWQSGRKFKVDVTLPENISVTYAINQRNDLALYFRPRFSAYDIENAPGGKRLLGYWELPIGLEHTLRLKRFSLFYSAGITPLRSFIYNEKSLSSMFRDTPSHMLAPNVFVNAGLRWSF